jgi:hypothetical protein
MTRPEASGPTVRDEFEEFVSQAEQRLGEVYVLLLNLQRSDEEMKAGPPAPGARPVPGWIRKRARDLLIAHGILSSPDTEGDRTP